MDSAELFIIDAATFNVQAAQSAKSPASLIVSSPAQAVLGDSNRPLNETASGDNGGGSARQTGPGQRQDGSP